MGGHASVRRRSAATVAAAALVLLAGACNQLLGTPAPEHEEGGADVGAMPDATGSADVAFEAAPDATTSDAGPDADASVTDSSVADDGADGADGATPPSCRGDAGPGVTECGPAGDSCCTSLPVSGGMYWRSFDVAADGGISALSYAATVSSFQLDEYEVTVGRFRQFVAATEAGWTPPLGSGIHGYLNGGLGLEQVVDGGVIYESGWQQVYDTYMSQQDGGPGDWSSTLTSCDPSTWKSTPQGEESLPINCVDWFEAFAFCIWDGGFLPSEAEWEYAAAGGNKEREYPWGTTDPGLESQYAVFNCEYPGGGPVDAETCSSPANIAPVGSAPLGAGRWGQLDLAGNVHEETFDFYGEDYVYPCVDCAELQSPGYRMARGGSWLTDTVSLLNTSRYFYPGQTRDKKGGFRCARAP